MISKSVFGLMFIQLILTIYACPDHSSVTINLKTPRCIQYNCECVTPETRFIQEPLCPSEEVRECYDNAKCKWIGGQCQWLQTPQLKKCLAEANNPCLVTSCPDICQRKGDPVILRPCYDTPIYECYNKFAKCELQKDGNCGFTKNCKFFWCVNNVS